MVKTHYCPDNPAAALPLQPHRLPQQRPHGHGRHSGLSGRGHAGGGKYFSIFDKKYFIILESSDNTTETAENAQEVPATNTAQTNHQEASPEPEQRQIRLIFGSKLKNLPSRKTKYKKISNSTTIHHIWRVGGQYISMISYKIQYCQLTAGTIVMVSESI